ncbi:hypothetical protein LRP88_07368 [Fusarium phalaenopsidis]
MSRPTTFSNTIHLRDFVDAITDDPTRENAPNYVGIQTDLNIFEEDGFCSSHDDINPIHTRIHAYLTREERELYTPNTFFYAHGRFSAAQHPGDVSDSDSDEYRRYLPGRWRPMVTVVGSVPSTGDRAGDPVRASPLYRRNSRLLLFKVRTGGVLRGLLLGKHEALA